MNTSRLIRISVLALLALVCGISYAIEPAGTMSYLHSISGAGGGAGLSFMFLGEVSTADVKAAIEDFKERYNSRLDNIEKEVGDFLVKGNRPGGGMVLDGPDLKALHEAARNLVLGNQQKANDAFMEAKAMQAGAGPNGGYVVHDVLSTGMTKIMAEISPIYRLARKIPLTAGLAFEEPIDRESAGASWVGETETRGDTTTPDLGMFRAELKEICAMPKATQTLIDTASTNILAWLQEKVGEAFATKESDAFHNGNGVIQPRGILTFTTAATADSSRTWGQFEHVVTGANGAFHTTKADPLQDLIAALKPQYRNGAVWLMNRRTANTIRKLKEATSDGYLWQPGLQLGQPDVLLGYRVEIDENMPDMAAGSLSIAFGNVEKTYTIIEQPGTKFLTDPYTDKPNVKLFAYRRVGGGVNNFESMKFLKFST